MQSIAVPPGVYLGTAVIILHHQPLITLNVQQLDVMAEYIEHRPPVCNVESSNPSRVKPMTFRTDTCRYLALRLSLMGHAKGLVSSALG